MSRRLILYIILLASYLQGAENDHFADALPLPGTEGSISFDLTDTTTESFEESGEGSIWYHWTAPKAGKLSVGVVPGGHDVDFRILTFAGTNPNELNRMLEKSSSEDFESKPMGVDAGQKVFFRVSASNSIEGGLQGELQFRFEIGIPHDSRFTPIDLGEQKAVTFLADNTGATRTVSENPGTFRSKSGTLWYRWTAPDDGILYLTHETLTGDIEDYGAVVTLFEGDGGTESNWPRSFTEGLGSLRYPVVKGDSFLFCYSTDEEDIPGPSALILNWTAVNEASYHGSPIVLDSDHQGEVEMTFQNALRDGSVSYQPLFRPWQSNSIRASIWYSWTAQESGTYLIKTTYGNNTLAIWTLSPAGDPIFLRKYGDDSLPFLAQQGETYLISALSSSLPGSLLNSYFRWSFQRIEVTSGDDFANRLDLGNESSWEIEESSVLTNGEEGDPILFDEDPQRSIWFTWTAPNSGDYLIDIPESSSNPTRLGIYTGSHLSNLEDVEIGTERVVFRAEKGKSYHIMIAERNFNDGGDFRLTLEPAQRYLNDNFASRIQLPGTRPILTDDLRYATSEPGEPGIENDSVATVWYEWKSVVSTVVWFDYNYITIYQSDLENPSLADLVKMPSREFYPVFGETYYIQYRKAGPSSIRPFSTSLRSGNSTYRNFPTPITDFEFREHLPSVTNLRVGVDGSEFERQTVEGTLIDSKVTAWWSWTAPESGFYHIKSHESYLGGLTVFTGDSRDSLDVVGDCIVELFFKAEIGTTYHIAAYAELVNRPYSLLGFDLSKIELTPANDNFLNAHDLGEEPTFSRPQESSFATVEPDEPIVDGQNPNHSVWFSYMPQFTGNYAMSLEEEDVEMNRFLAIYSGENINTLVEIEVGLDFLTTTLTAGERYFIQVASEVPMAYRLTGELIHPEFTNNNFTDATIWTGASHSDFGNTLLADLEESEPLPENAFSATASVWWKWTPPLSGATYFKTSGEDFVFSIYRGDDFASLELLQSNRSSFMENAFHAIAGETYYLQMVATPPRRSNNFSFSLTQSPESAPPNDLFANATPLAGENFTLQLNGVGSTAELGEPNDFKRSIWYSWQAPSAGVYRLTQYPPNIGIFRGESLDTLVKVASGSLYLIEANEGEEFKIAIEDDLRFRDIALSLERVSPPENDAFANPVKLGASEEISLKINQTHSTFEPGEPEPRDPYFDSSGGSVWLEWIAPRSGLVSLSDSSLVYTGDHLANLKLHNNLSSAQFQAIQGMTYRIAMIQKSGSFWPVSSIFRLTMATMPNDDFDDRIIIPSELPYSWEGTLTNATFELSNFKFDDGDAWWEWTAPRDGQIFMRWNGGTLLPYRVSDFGFHGVSHDGLIEVRSGETFVFQFFGILFEQLNFSLQYADPSPSGSSFEDAQVIETFAEPFPVVRSENGQGKHWYRWTAESSSTISFEGVGGREIFANLYTVDSSNTNSLSSVAPQDPDDWSSPVWTRFEIIAGRQYWLAVATNSSYHYGGFSWRAVFGPPGDRFAGAPALPAIAPITWNGSTTRAGREEGEPGIGGTFPDRTVWRTWTAPDSGFYSFRNDRFKTAIFFGERIDALKILAEGHQGIFYATHGTKYRIVVNSVVTEDSFTLTIAPEDSPYERWRQSFFGQTLTPEGAANADPDFDGRHNLIEMAFGSDPSRYDGPLNLWMEQIENGLLLSIRRPTGIQNFEFFFEISKDLNNWQSTLDLNTEPSIEPTAEGQEIFRVLVKNPEWTQQPGLFLRLLVRQDL